MNRFREGDPEAFHSLYETYGDRALRLARVVTKDDGLAADAVQEAFLRVYRYRRRYDAKRPFPVWLNRIVVNECRRLMGKQRGLRLVTEAVREETDVAVEDTSHYVEYQSLYRALEDLPETQRVPLVLKYCNGCKETEIAEILDISHSAVKSRLYGGRQKLRSAMEREAAR
mgnify:CR=1 FL=1